MKSAPYDTKAPKQSVSLTQNSDLYAKANSLAIEIGPRLSARSLDLLSVRFRSVESATPGSIDTTP